MTVGSNVHREQIYVVYSILISLAFAAAISHIINVYDNPNIKWEALLAGGLVLFFTIPRFFIGNIAFYEKTYKFRKAQVDSNQITPRRAGAESLFDFYATLAEFLIFIFIGYSIGNFMYFYVLLLSLSLLDIAWHVVAYFKAETRITTIKSSLCWVIINLVTALYCGVVLLFKLDMGTVYVITIMVYFAVALGDYLYNIEIYFHPSY